MHTPPPASHHLAIDLGAESGRVILATLAEGRVTLEVMHRFPTPYLKTDGDGLRWNLPLLKEGISEGLTKAAAKAPHAASIGVDTWGVDYGLVGADGEVITLPYCYRDERNAVGIDAVHAVIPKDVLYRRTGVESMAFNTIYQLAAHLKQAPQQLAAAQHLLFMPDLLHHWLGGRPANEFSIAGTSGLLKPGKPEWDFDLIRQLGLPVGIFKEVVRAGTPLGHLKPELAKRFGFAAAPAIVTPAGHDTASAVGASPGEAGATAYISSGTWSLFGVVANAPVIAAAGQTASLGNEISADGRVRVNRNIMGLWLIQECRRAWQAEGREYSYQELEEMALKAGPSGIVLDVNDQRFFAPSLTSDPMPSRIIGWLKQHGHDITDHGRIMRIVVDGLASAYGRTLVDVERETGTRLGAVHVLGGGSKHLLLAQLTANACKRPVITGPVEATALGNVLVQAKGTGAVQDDAHLRRIIAASVTLETFQPG